MAKHSQKVVDSEPLDPLKVGANYFSLDCLTLTFKLLRKRYPSHALTIQNIIAELRVNQTHNYQDKKFAVFMEAEHVRRIISALSSIAENSSKDIYQTKSSRIKIHQALLDWLLYAQNLLEKPDKYCSRK